MTEAAREAPALACRGVGVGYGATDVVRDLDLRVERGEMLVLLGPSGSGKTTILSAVAGFVPLRAGSIEIAGRRVADGERHEPPDRRDVAVVFQSYALWPHLSALETVAYPLRRAGRAGAAARAEAATILEALGIGHLAARRPAELSGGEQQRVGLGRALARRAMLQLFDEPTAHVDAPLRDRLLAELAEHRVRSGAAGIYATHDTAEALALADRVALVRDGRIVQVGSARQVYEAPVDLWAARLTGPASILDVPAVATAGGRVIVEVGGTRVEVPAGGSVVAGSGATLLVRPDWVAFDGPLPGRVAATAFRGTHTDYRLATPAGEVVVRRSGPPIAAPGAAVGWGIGRCWLVPRHAAPDGATSPERAPVAGGLPESFDTERLASRPGRL